MHMSSRTSPSTTGLAFNEACSTLDKRLRFSPPLWAIDRFGGKVNVNKTLKRYVVHMLEHAVSRGGRPSAPTGMTTSLEKRLVEHEAVLPSTEPNAPSKAEGLRSGCYRLYSLMDRMPIY